MYIPDSIGSIIETDIIRENRQPQFLECYLQTIPDLTEGSASKFNSMMFNFFEISVNSGKALFASS